MNNHDILTAMNKVVYGHEEAKKTLITLIQRSKIRHYKKWGLLEPTSLKPMSCLLIGPSGTGKTYMVDSLRKIMKFPYLYMDATHLVPTGAHGVTCEDLKKRIQKTITTAVEAKECSSVDGALDQLIVFVDEFDKLAYSFESSGNWNTHTQANFLTLFDSKDTYYTGISWIFAGTFQNCRTEKNGNPLGFFTSPTTQDKRTITDDELIQTGLLPEIVGRISSIVELDTFTLEDYYQILTTRLLPAKQATLQELFLTVEFPDSALLIQMAKMAVESAQGVRYLERELNRYYLEAEFNHLIRRKCYV